MKTRKSNKSIIQFIHRNTLVPRADIRDVFRAAVKFTANELLLGSNVNFFGLGTFKLKVRKGRTVTWKKNSPQPQLAGRTSVQPDSNYVRFTSGAKFRAQLNPTT